MPTDHTWQVVFYRNPSGRCPVVDFLNILDRDLRVRVNGKIEMLNESGLYLSSDHVKKVGGKIWELRYNQVRILYAALPERRFILLHAIRKKQDRLPRRDIRIAQERFDAICDQLAII